MMDMNNTSNLKFTIGCGSEPFSPYRKKPRRILKTKRTVIKKNKKDTKSGNCSRLTAEILHAHNREQLGRSDTEIDSITQNNYTKQLHKTWKV